MRKFICLLLALCLMVPFAMAWNRVSVYDLMGFRDFITLEDMIDEDILTRYKASGYSYNLYKRLLAQRYPGEDIILRRYVSDAYDFGMIEDMYEEKDPDEPFFLFNVTMQFTWFPAASSAWTPII